MTIFVTGATGFLGSHVARALAEQGADLRLLVRPTSNLKNLEGLKAETVTGDLCDPSSLDKGHGGLRHRFSCRRRLSALGARSRSRCTAPTSRVRAPSSKRRARTACARCYTHQAWPPWASQEMAVLPTKIPRFRWPDMIGHYKRSKFMAEQLALEAGRSGMRVVTVNPTTPVGEQDIKPTPTGRIVVDFLKRKFPAYVETGLNLVDVRECARGHIAALEKGKSGERYILGGENLTLKQILDKLGAISGLPSPKVKLPYFVAYAAGAVDQTVSGRMLGREPRATVETVRMGKKKCGPASAKAERELGWKSFPSMMPCAAPWSGSRPMVMSRTSPL